MKMDRNENPDGKGKYALLQLRKILTADDGSHPPEVVAAIAGAKPTAEAEGRSGSA